MDRSQSGRRDGFTLVELLVVIAIIGVLVSLLLPAIQAARESARRTSCQNNLRQIGIGLQNYASTYQMFPAGQQQFSYYGYTWAWSAMLLDFFEEGAVKSRLSFQYTPLAPQNKDAVAIKISVYLCPSTSRRDAHRTGEDIIGDANNNGRWDPGEGLALLDYAGITGPDKYARNPQSGGFYKENDGVLLSIGPLIKPGPPQILGAPRIRLRQITDGLSNTMIIGEVSGRGWDTMRVLPNGGWAYGTNVIPIVSAINVLDPKTGLPLTWSSHDGLVSDHPGGGNVLCCDASVHFLEEGIDLNLIQALSSRAGGEILPGTLLQ